MSQLAALRRPPEAVLDHIGDGSDVVVGVGNGEPRALLDAIEAHAGRYREVRLHQMLPLRSRRYIDGTVAGLRHVSWFLSLADRDAFHAGACDLVPNSFSEVPHLMRSLAPALVVATVSPPDRHGYFSLGCHAEYTASFIGELPFFVEVNPRMPRTFGENQIHVSQLLGWCEADTPMVELPARAPLDIDRRIAARIAERIPDGATLQAGIGAVPNAVLAQLDGHRDLGVHTELLSDGFVDLVEKGVVTGTRKRTTATRSSRPARSARRASSTSSPRTPGSSSGRSTTPTTRAWSPRRTTWWRSTPPSRSTSSASVPPNRSAATTGRRPEDSPTSPAAR